MSKKIPIKAIGQFFEIDAQDYIVNPCDTAHIDATLQPIIDYLVEQYQNNYGALLHSVYLRGSVPRGLVNGFSDIDMFALIKKKDIRWKEVDWAKEAQADIIEKYSFDASIELMCSTWYEDFYLENPRMVMLIKTQSLCIYGEDLSDAIPPFKIGKELMLHHRWLEEDISKFLAKENPQIAECQSFMKVLIRSGFELVMERADKFTPDLYLCYHTFSKYYPQWEKDMRLALYFYLNPPNDMSEVRQFVQNFAPQILLEVKKILK